MSVDHLEEDIKQPQVMLRLGEEGSLEKTLDVIPERKSVLALVGSFWFSTNR